VQLAGCKWLILHTVLTWDRNSNETGRGTNFSVRRTELGKIELETKKASSNTQAEAKDNIKKRIL
jgi:hypothetical protein